MNTTYRVLHKTSFTYSTDVSLSQQLTRLEPRATQHQEVQSSTVLFDPPAIVRRSGQDYFGNSTIFASIQEPHRRLTISASSTVTVASPNWPAANLSTPWDTIVQTLRFPDSSSAVDASQFCFPSPHVDVPPEIRELTDDIFIAERPIIEAVNALTNRIYTNFTYEGGVTDIQTPVARVLASRKGVCQDFAHVQLACLRYLGIAARYVSGYLLTHPTPGTEKLIGADESHAWLSVWTPKFGWIDFDPTNNLMPDKEHIVLGWGRDYADVSPINGFIIGGGSHELDVSVDVSPTHTVAP